MFCLHVFSKKIDLLIDSNKKMQDLVLKAHKENSKEIKGITELLGSIAYNTDNL